MIRNILKPGMAAAALIMSAVQVSAAGFGDCALTGTTGSVKIPTVTEGTLTVAAILPSPDSFRGDSPETIDGGFEYRSRLAGFGFERFDRLYCGGNQGRHIHVVRITALQNNFRRNKFH